MVEGSGPETTSPDLICSVARGSGEGPGPPPDQRSQRDSRYPPYPGRGGKTGRRGVPTDYVLNSLESQVPHRPSPPYPIKIPERVNRKGSHTDVTRRVNQPQTVRRLPFCRNVRTQDRIPVLSHKGGYTQDVHEGTRRGKGWGWGFMYGWWRRRVAPRPLMGCSSALVPSL